MRHLPYTWKDVLEEAVPRTLIGLELLNKEKQRERDEYDRVNRQVKRS